MEVANCVGTETINRRNYSFIVTISVCLAYFDCRKFRQHWLLEEDEGETCTKKVHTECKHRGSGSGTSYLLPNTMSNEKFCSWSFNSSCPLNRVFRQWLCTGFDYGCECLPNLFPIIHHCASDQLDHFWARVLQNLRSFIQRLFSLFAHKRARSRNAIMIISTAVYTQQLYTTL